MIYALTYRLVEFNISRILCWDLLAKLCCFSASFLGSSFGNLECLLVKSSTPPGLSSTPQSQLTALLVLTPLPSTPPPKRVVTR